MSGILVLVDDLFFLAKIQQTAKLTGVVAEAVTPENLQKRLMSDTPRAVIIDLNHRSGAALDALRTIKNTTATVPVLGFLSHVQTDLAHAARAAGCDILLARSAFTMQLPELLQKLSGKSPPSGA